MIKFIWDFISTIVVAFIAYPVIRFIETRKRVYLMMAIVVFVWLFVLELRDFLPDALKQYMKRPSKARNCNVINQGGFQGNALGMPSGHVLLTSYVTACMYMISPSWQTLAFFIIATTVMAMSRIARSCHTVVQTIVGAVIGYASAYATMKLESAIP
jgi:membrane-associated phospholipid phosphatase